MSADPCYVQMDKRLPVLLLMDLNNVQGKNKVFDVFGKRYT